jgi:hypothetical protein
MVQATAMVMYRKGSSFHNSIINKDSPRMLARQRDNDERQFKSPPSFNTVSLQRISFFSEIRSPRSVTPFFCQNTPFPPKSNKTAPAAKPLSACILNEKSQILVMISMATDELIVAMYPDVWFVDTTAGMYDVFSCWELVYSQYIV